MSDLDSEIAFYRSKIWKLYENVLSNNGAVPPTAIDEVMNKYPFAISENDRDNIRRILESSFSVEQTLGDAIINGYKPWLRSRSGNIDYFYWNRLKNFYIANDVIPPNVISSLDQVTNEVLDYCGNPEDMGHWARRGMVMGHVQSGKTTNYSALICKAADAGYKVIILLAGITNSLRTQTQERIDEAFIGRKSVFNMALKQKLPIVNFGAIGREPAFGTTVDQDFDKDKASGYGVTLDALKEPIIFVVKKNKKSLENLRDWIKNQAHGEKVQHSLLLIDDEADNASINVANGSGNITAINKAIREILHIFSRSSYVGYTATPFANIFIDPDSVDEMISDDLFPRHFIRALDPPSNYVGSARLFADDGDLKVSTIRLVDDYEELLPLKHKKDAPLKQLPASLLDATRAFVIARAIRFHRGDGQKHCSMMVNVSRFNEVQEKVSGLLYKHLEAIKKAIETNSKAGAEGWKDSQLKELRRVFEKEFCDAGVELEDLIPILHEAAHSIEIRTINMKGGALDYSAHKKDGLHVIAIGGLALSRGLTLEGLTVSYILRNTAASDTLMQMARWFGYRPGYEDICRLYLPLTSLEHYEFIHEAVEELREEIRAMKLLNQTPEQFGLKVRESPTTLRITAANKMRSASLLTVAQNYACRHIEGHVLYNKPNINSDNIDALQRFVSGLGNPEQADGISDLSIRADVAKNIVWRSVEGHRVSSLIADFTFPPQHGDLGLITKSASLFGDYVQDRVDRDLEYWDVVIPINTNLNAIRVSLFEQLGPLALRSRSSGHRDGDTWRITGRRNRLADPMDARLLLSTDQMMAVPAGSKGDTPYCRVRSKPLLLIHLLNISPEDDQRKADLGLQGPVVSLSFCTPPTTLVPIERSYYVAPSYRKQLELFATEADDDDLTLQSGD